MPPDDANSRTDSTTLSTTLKHRRSLARLAAAALILGVALLARVIERVAANLDHTTLEGAVPSVTVIHPGSSPPNQELVLPGYTQAFTDSPVYARTSGYLQAWHFDIGARVKKGELLAEIETPEVDQQLRQARADLETAPANLDLAQITAARDEDLFETRSVSTQDRDNANGALAADKAIVHSHEGNVARLEQLQSYEKVYAPFDGIITARNTDTGSLIDADANSPSKKLFHLAATATLRVYVSVPQPYVRAAQPGATATLTLDEFPGASFRGTLVRNADAIDLSSRTLLVEFDIDNPDGRLLPGACTFVHLSLPRSSLLAVPANTLLFRKEQAAHVRNGHTQLIRVMIGRDHGNRIEILSGLQLADQEGSR